MTIRYSSKVILLTSDENWSDVWHTQIRFAIQLSKDYNVIYLNPPSKWSIFSLINGKQEIEISKTLVVLKYKNIIPSFFGPFSLLLNDLINQIRINRVCNRRKWHNKFISWHFDRYRAINIWKKNKSVKHIYHVIDPWADLNYDRILSRMCDLIVVVSSRYFNHYSGLNPNVILEGQGFDDSALSFMPIDNKCLFPGSLLLLGTLLDDVDYDLLVLLAERFSSRTLLIIGPSKISSENRNHLLRKLLNMNNVVWLGPLSPEKHLPYVWASSVCLVTYDISGGFINKRREFGTPLKALTYLGCFKPIVSNIDCEIPGLRDIAIFEEYNYQNFLERVENVLNGLDDSANEAVADYLSEHTYENIIKRIFARLNLNLSNNS